MNKWKYFTFKEFECKCGCGKNEIKEDFVDKLDILRHFYAGPLVVTSGYRCPEYNSSVSNTGSTGPHTTGRAVDFSLDGQDAYKVIKYAYILGMTGIGINQKGNKRFVHLDDLDKEPRPNMWSY